MKLLAFNGIFKSFGSSINHSAGWTPRRFYMNIDQTGALTKMTKEQVGDWIERLSKEKGIGNAETLKQIFVKNKIDGKALLDLEPDFFPDLGIPFIRDMIEVQRGISKLKHEERISNMSEDQLGYWIENHAKDNHVSCEDAASMKQKLKDNGIDGKMILTVDRDFLRNIGITNVDQILVIERAIAKLYPGEKYQLLPWQREGSRIDRNKWVEDLEKTEYANELLNSIEESLSSGVNRYTLTRFLQTNERNSCDLYARTSQRDLWNEVYMYLESKTRGNAVVTGNPGIGKSRSMTYLLRLLLQNGKTVIYQANKDRRVYAFIPPDGHLESSLYKVWNCEMRDWDSSGCFALQNSGNYCLIDSNERCDIAGIAAHIVVTAASYREYHEFLKLDRTLPWCMPIWKKEELKALQPYIFIGSGVALTDDEFESRYFNFGGRISFIYVGWSAYEMNLMFLDACVRNLGMEKLTKALIFGVMNESEEKSNMLFVCDVLGLEATYSSLTYKYLWGTKGNMKLLIGSERIRQHLYEYYWGEIMNLVKPQPLCSVSLCNVGVFSHRRELFQFLAGVYIEHKVNLDVWIQENKETPHHTLQWSPITRRREFSGTWDDYLTECSRLSYSSTLSSTDSREILQFHSPIYQRFVDTMDACDRAHLFVVESEHQINVKHLEQTVQVLKRNPQNPLKLYLVIPESRIKEFKWIYVGTSELDEKTREYITTCVQVFLICVPEDQYQDQGESDEESDPVSDD